MPDYDHSNDPWLWLERLREGDIRTRRLLGRSLQQIKHSLELLQQNVPQNRLPTNSYDLPEPLDGEPPKNPRNTS